jgi:transcriptional regulator with XRE-family HTH domain/AraC-like DNA-binding protein
MWVARSVGELLAASSHVQPRPSSDAVSRALDFFRGRAGYPNLRALALAVGCNYTTVRGWQLSARLPTLDQLLRLCFGLGTTPLDFLTSTLEREVRQCVALQGAADSGIELGAVGISPVSSEAPEAAGTAARGEGEVVVDIPRFPSRGPNRRHQQARLRHELQVVLTKGDSASPSMKEVARRLGCDYSYLRRHFPDICCAIKEQHRLYTIQQREERERSIREGVRLAVYEIHAEGRYPSYLRVEGHLRKPSWMRTQCAREAWREALRELG